MLETTRFKELSAVWDLLSIIQNPTVTTDLRKAAAMEIIREVENFKKEILDAQPVPVE